jgi:hypothetical protein
MASLRSDGQGWYRLLLKLYPKDYKHDYEEEMLTTLQAMYSEAKTSAAKRQLTLRILKDYLLSLSRESLYATGNSFQEAPGTIKRDFAISAGLVAPFFLIFIYNISSFILRHADVLSRLESHTWVIYSIVLPIIGLVLSVKTCFSGIYGQLVRHQWRQALSVFISNWLFLGVFVVILAMIAIF